MTKRHLFSKTLLFFMASLLAGCAMFQPQQPNLPPIRVEYSQWWGDYVLLVAVEKGYFKEHNVNVEPVYYKVFSDSYSDLAAGQIDAGLIAIGDVMNINSSTPMRVIGLEDDGGNMPIVARSEIQTIADLKGKNIGTLAGTQYELLVVDMLASAGMTTADVAVQNVDPEGAAAALSQNKIQAAFTWEPFTSQAIKSGAHILYPTDKNLRLFPDTIAFRQSVIDQRPEEIRGFLKAWFQAVEYSAQNPDEVRKIAAKYVGIPVEQINADPNLKIYTYEDNLNSYYTTLAENDSIFEVAQKTADYLMSSGIISEMPDIEELVTPQFLLDLK